MYPISYSMLGHILGEEAAVIDEAIAQRSFVKFASCEWESQFSQRCCYIADVSVAYIRAKANPMCVFAAPKSQIGALPCPANLILVSGCDSVEELYRLFSTRVSPYLVWIERVESKMLRGCTLQDIFDISAERLSNWVALVDSSFSLMAYTKENAIDDALCQELVETGHYSEQAIAILKFNAVLGAPSSRAQLTVHHEALNYPAVMREYVVQHESRAHLIMVENVKRENALNRDIFALFSDFVFDYFNVHGYGSSGARKPKDTLLFSLSSEESVDLATCIIQGHELGISRGNCFYAGLVAMDNATHAALSSCVMFLEQTLPNCFSSVRGSQIVLLCYGEKAELEQKIVACEQTVARYLTERKATVYLSALCQGFKDLPDSFRQARELYRLASEKILTQEKKIPGVMRFDDYFLSWFFNAATVDNRFKNYCLDQRFVCILYHADQEAYQFIRHFLLCERSASRTGKELFLNRTTVLYRVKAIEKAYDVSLEDPDVRFEFLLLDRYQRECAPGFSSL